MPQNLSALLLSILLSVMLTTPSISMQKFPKKPGMTAWEMMEYGKSYLGQEPPDLAAAARYFDKAAASGETYIIYDIAEMYRKGTEVPKNLPEAARFYRLIADKDPWAQFQLGELLRTGKGGVKKNVSEARRLLTKSVNATKDQWPKLALAQLLENSRNTRDLRYAVMLYQSAASQGNKYAKEYLMRICQHNNIAQCATLRP